MTPEVKDQIDDMTYVELLEKWRFSTEDSPFFKGSTAIYFADRMDELKADMQLEDVARISKRVGY